jgi:hypothetical protein
MNKETILQIINSKRDMLDNWSVESLDFDKVQSVAKGTLNTETNFYIRFEAQIQLLYELAEIIQTGD